MSPVTVFDTTGRTSYPPHATEQIADLDVNLVSRKIADQQALLAECGDADIILMTALRFDRQVMEQLPRLRAIIRYGVGLDTIDLDAAANLGIEVRNTRDFCSEEIADHALGLLIACARGLFRDAIAAREGRWGRGDRRVRRLRGRCLGIVGFGAIGRALGSRAKGLGMDVIVTDPALSAAAADEAGVRLAPFEKLLRDADFISLHCPLNGRTHHLLGPDEFVLMKDTAYLINTARGGLVDQVALVEALASGSIAGAGLDVLDPEPPAPNDPLSRMDNVIITPHVSWYSAEALEDLVVGVFAHIADIVKAMGEE